MNERHSVLVVSAQFPFPARSGFTMRVSELARRLAVRHDVTLLALAGRAEHAAAAEVPQGVSLEIVEREPQGRASLRASQALSAVSSLPFACRRVHWPEMQRAIDRLFAERPFDVVQLESSVLCAYRFPHEAALVLDEHNVEYEVFERMYATERSGVRRAYNRLEFHRFRSFERRWWQRADACVVTSEREHRIVAAHAPATPTAVVPNGVDLDRFAPSAVPVRPRTLVFNGILDYRPNVDAVEFLMEDIWPRVLAHCPDARLEIVGRGDAAFAHLRDRQGVVLTGEVPDVRPHLASAAVVAVPIRMGGGTRLKVVEGLAMGKALVSTTLGCEGVGVTPGEHLEVADDAAGFAERVVELFGDRDRADALGRAGRALMERDYSWDLAAERLEAVHAHALRARARGGLRPSLEHA